MPLLRFTRDKRGYETTSLVHTGRRNGRSQQRVLYWFRTPPGVKVGRPALDEDAIRLIEEQNPDIEFDWPKILEAQPTAAPADDARGRRSRRDRPRPTRSAVPPVAVPQQDRPSPPAAEPEALELSEPERVEPVELEPLELLEPEVVEAFEQLTHPQAEEKIDLPAMPVEQTLGREQLTRLRARYAELLARIAERGGDADRVVALRTEAESLNPDMWVTEEEVRQGMEAFEPKIRDLRASLGLRRRRRSRRGGRRRRGEGERPESAAPPENDSGEGEG